MKVDLSTEDILQITSSLNKDIALTRNEFFRTGDRTAKRNRKLKIERLQKLNHRLLQAVEDNFGESKDDPHNRRGSSYANK